MNQPGYQAISVDYYSFYLMSCGILIQSLIAVLIIDLHSCWMNNSYSRDNDTIRPHLRTKPRNDQSEQARLWLAVEPWWIISQSVKAKEIDISFYMSHFDRFFKHAYPHLLSCSIYKKNRAKPSSQVANVYISSKKSSKNNLFLTRIEIFPSMRKIASYVVIWFFPRALCVNVLHRENMRLWSQENQ